MSDDFRGAGGQFIRPNRSSSSISATDDLAWAAGAMDVHPFFCKKYVFTASMAISSSELFFFLRDGSGDDRPVLGTSTADELGVMGCSDLIEPLNISKQLIVHRSFGYFIATDLDRSVWIICLSGQYTSACSYFDR